MKFVALALALLLAVGSQAATLQADAPTELQHIRAAMDVYLAQVKDSATRALSQLDDSEYKEIKENLIHRLDEVHNQIQALRESVSPVTDSVVSTISDATADLRATLVADIEALKTDLEPKREHLRKVVNEHIEEYRTLLEPVIVDYQARHAVEMEAMKVKLEPVVEKLRVEIAKNVEETKSALEPIVESVRGKLTQYLETLKQLAVPYVEEYKDMLKQAYSQAQAVSADDLKNLKGQITPLAEEIKVKVQKIAEAIAATYSSKN